MITKVDASNDCFVDGISNSSYLFLILSNSSEVSAYQNASSIDAAKPLYRKLSDDTCKGKIIVGFPMEIKTKIRYLIIFGYHIFTL